MASVRDVAAAILKIGGPMSTMKLQKLAYYSQAWHLVWDEEPLFDSRIEAWANGPVCRDLYETHRGQFSVDLDTWRYGDVSNLTKDEYETVEAVVDSYGKLNGRQLSHLTHEEGPWRDARGHLAPGQRGDAEITLEAMASFYAALDASEDAEDVEAIADDWNDA